MQNLPHSIVKDDKGECAGMARRIRVCFLVEEAGRASLWRFAALAIETKHRPKGKSLSMPAWEVRDMRSRPS